MAYYRHFFVALLFSILLISGCSTAPPDTSDTSASVEYASNIPTDTISSPTIEDFASNTLTLEQIPSEQDDIILLPTVSETTSTSSDTSISAETEISPHTNDTVTLVISDIPYTIPYQEQASVEDIMYHAQDLSLITYETKQYMGMGSFITSINNKKQDIKQGYYWIYKINGQKANAGISTTIIHKGDIIEWNYEKNDQ